ncbi:penicillin acylase family protein [Dyella sp.]|uniref:penicillin acylase family protein n=1 Tax=Dyella sp. TaxID=1869338 RepID=UPI002ED4D7B8
MKTDKPRRHGALRRWLAAVATVLLLLMVAAVMINLWILHRSLPELDGWHVATSAGAPSKIVRDAHGLVTIEADDELDADYDLGFVHAQERFFEMDLMRRVAAGELAELVGQAALKTDIGHRRHRLRAVVHQAYENLTPQQRSRLIKYAWGVNRGLDELGARPWEYVLLRSKPREWLPEDSLLVIAAMYLDLNEDGNNLRELNTARMRAALPGPVVDFLLAADPAWEAPLVGGQSPAVDLPGPDVLDLRRSPAGDNNAKVASLAAAVSPALDDMRIGSNSFAVAGSLSSTGSAILANDMHLGLRVPNIWFRARLRYHTDNDSYVARHGSRAVDLNGLTLPGVPALVVGSNGHIAWGFTNSYGDWQDWFRVQRDPAHPSRYKVPEGWATIESHDEVIAIKGAAPYTLKVEDTRWGPIMGEDVDGTPLALSWIGALPRSYNLGLAELSLATNVHEALGLAHTFGIPPQNMLVADKEGHIGWTLASNAIPLRSGMHASLPTDGAQPGNGWTGWANAAQYPRVEDPASGRLWTANNRIVDGDALSLVGNGGYDVGARAQQIRNDLQAHDRFAPTDLLAIQLDDRAIFLTRWQQLLQATLAGQDDPRLAQMRQLTATWGGRAAADSVDYRLVRAFREQVFHEVLAPFIARVSARHGDFAWPTHDSAEAAVWTMIDRKPMHLLDPHYADWHALLLDAARQVADKLAAQPGGLAARTWGEENRAAIDHPLARVLPSGLARYLDMPHDRQSGDANMPRVAGPAFGSSERLVASPGHENVSILHMPGGQSDHPMSPFFGVGHADWFEGTPTPLLPGEQQHALEIMPMH